MSSKELVLHFDRSQLAAINRFRQRAACWDLTRRGEVGETILHLCFLNNTEKHLTIARIMLRMYPKMVLDIYEGNDYYGTVLPTRCTYITKRKVLLRCINPW